MQLGPGLELALTSKDAAAGLGYLIGAGSVLLYTPMIYRVASRQSAAGLSPSTWLLKLGCYFTTDLYNIVHAYPLSSFSETITLFFQALVMLLLVCYFEGMVSEWVLECGGARARAGCVCAYIQACIRSTKRRVCMRTRTHVRARARARAHTHTHTHTHAHMHARTHGQAWPLVAASGGAALAGYAVASNDASLVTGAQVCD